MVLGMNVLYAFVVKNNCILIISNNLIWYSIPDYIAEQHIQPKRSSINADTMRRILSWSHDLLFINTLIM